eukprot:4835544-Prymnesium_polylepis.1
MHSTPRRSSWAALGQPVRHDVLPTRARWLCAVAMRGGCARWLCAQAHEHWWLHKHHVKWKVTGYAIRIGFWLTTGSSVGWDQWVGRVKEVRRPTPSRPTLPRPRGADAHAHPHPRLHPHPPSSPLAPNPYPHLPSASTCTPHVHLHPASTSASCIHVCIPLHIGICSNRTGEARVPHPMQVYCRAAVHEPPHQAQDVAPPALVVARPATQAC